MKQPASAPSFLGRSVLGLLDAAALMLLLMWMAHCSYMQITFIVAAFAMGLLAVLSLAAWRRGFRWFLSRGALRFYGWLAAGIVSVIVLFYAEEGWRGKRAWAALQQEAAARGESLELASVIPPAVPEEENFALAPGVPELLGYSGLVAGPTNSGQTELRFYQHDQEHWPRANWALQRPTDLAAWQEFFRQHSTTNAPRGSTPAADVLQALSRYDAALAVLRAANERPKLRYPLAYEKGLFALIDPHPTKGAMHGQFSATSLLAAVRILSLHALAELAQDQADAALQDTLLALRMADSLATQPYEHFHRFRNDMLLQCLQPVWEGLASHRWNEAQLLTLQQRFGGEDLLASFHLAVRGNTLVTMNLADQFQAFLQGRQSWMSVHLASTQDEVGPITTVCRLLYPVGWLYQDKAWMYRVYERRSDPLKALDPEVERQRWSEVRAATDPILLCFVAPKIYESFWELAPATLFAHTACQQAAVACALERHRLAQGRYPDNLKALLPAELKQVPADLLDPKDGALKYRREADGGFTLYSVGLNRIDDHGTPSPPEKNWRGVEADRPRLAEGDWVWRQPGN
jgi:hypothetical protein